MLGITLLVGISIVSLRGNIHAQEQVGLSITSFPDNTGKVDEIESLLNEKFGDGVVHWTEESVITYPEGEKVELYHYFEHPTDDEILAQAVEIITGLPYVPPQEK